MILRILTRIAILFVAAYLLIAFLLPVILPVIGTILSLLLLFALETLVAYIFNVLGFNLIDWS